MHRTEYSKYLSVIPYGQCVPQLSTKKKNMHLAVLCLLKTAEYV